MNVTVAILARGSVALSESLVLGITISTTYRTVIGMNGIRGFSLSKRDTLSQVMFNNGEYAYISH